MHDFQKQFVSNNLQNPILSFVKEYLSRLQRQTSGVQQEDPDLFEDQGLKQEQLFVIERADAVRAIHIHVSPLSMRANLTKHFFEIQCVKERDVEIRKTEQSIEDLSGIFKQLAVLVLVIYQDTIRDRIDYNLEYPNGYIHTFTCSLPRPTSKRHCCTGRKK
jgi:hypothetical protein